MPRGFAGEDEAGRANDPSGIGAGGGGRSEDADNRQAQIDRGQDQRAERAAVQAAMDEARRTGRTLGVFTPDDYKDGVLKDQQGILGLIGYDTQKSFFDNIYDMAVPGRNTPLGAGTAFVKGLSIPQQVALGIANTIVGKEMNQAKTPTETAVSDSIVGKDSIVGDLATMPQTGIASGYTGRPDDALGPVSVKGNVNTLEQQAIDAVKDMINQQSQSNLSTPKNTLDQDRVVKALTQGTGTPLPDPVFEIADSGYLSQVQSGLQKLADNIVSIPGGYMDTKTGLTYSGDYQRSAPARTVTGQRTQGVTPFSLEALQQNVKSMFGS